MSSSTDPIWTATANLPSYSALTVDTAADVCVIGAGIAGLTTAYQLTQVGKSVVVLDDGAIGSGMTSATTAHLVNALDDRFFELEPGGRGEFTVLVDGKKIAEKTRTGFPTEPALIEAVKRAVE